MSILLYTSHASGTGDKLQTLMGQYRIKMEVGFNESMLVCTDNKTTKGKQNNAQLVRILRGLLDKMDVLLIRGRHEEGDAYFTQFIGRTQQQIGQTVEINAELSLSKIKKGLFLFYCEEDNDIRTGELVICLSNLNNETGQIVVLRRKTIFERSYQKIDPENYTMTTTVDNKCTLWPSEYGGTFEKMNWDPSKIEKVFTGHNGQVLAVLVGLYVPVLHSKHCYLR